MAGQAMIKVQYDLSVPIEGKTLEDMLANARKLTPTDIFKIPSAYDHNDSKIELQGVWTTS